MLLLLGAAPAGATAGVILGSFAQGACSQRSFGHDDLERSASFAQLFFHVVKAAFHAVL